MCTFVRVVVVAAITLLMSMPSQASILNGSFEDGGGSLDDWSSLGIADAVGDGSSQDYTEANYGAGVTPTDLLFQAYLRNAPAVNDIRLEAATIEEIETTLGLSDGTLQAIADASQSGAVTNGSVIYQSITVNAGDTLTFDWNFLTEAAPHLSFNDFSFWSLSDESGTELPVAEQLGDVFQTSIPGGSAVFATGTGYTSYPGYTILADGTYTLGFGVINVGGEAEVSALLVDNVRITPNSAAVPEPATMAIWSVVGLAGLAFVRRRRNK